jgi:hypothetical protein
MVRPFPKLQIANSHLTTEDEPAADYEVAAVILTITVARPENNISGGPEKVVTPAAGVRSNCLNNTPNKRLAYAGLADGDRG